MGRKKIAPDVAVRFYEDNENDTLAARIMAKLPAGTNKGTLFKEALCHYYNKNSDNNSTQALTHEDVRAIVHSEVENSVAQMEKRILIEMSKMFGSIEGQLKSGVVTTLSANSTPNVVVTETKEPEPDIPDVPNSTLDFLSTFVK